MLLERYIPEERISREKEMEIIGMVHRQVLRLENYVQKMGAVQKLEDIMPAYENVAYGEFISLCTETAKQIDERVSIRAESGPETVEAEETRASSEKPPPLSSTHNSSAVPRFVIVNRIRSFV